MLPMNLKPQDVADDPKTSRHENQARSSAFTKWMGPHYVLGLKTTLSMIKCGHHVDGYTLPSRLENQAQSNVVTMWMGTCYMLGLKTKHNQMWSPCGWVLIMC